MHIIEFIGVLATGSILFGTHVSMPASLTGLEWSDHETEFEPAFRGEHIVE